MRLRKICKSKKVIGVILSILVAFCATFTSQAKTIETMNNPNRIEYKLNKTIGIKNKEMANMNMTTVNINGKLYTGKKAVYKCTAYTSAANEGGAYSYSGKRLQKGMIAADLKVLPIGTKVYIPYFNQVFTVEDTGSAIKNQRLDIFMNSKKEALNFGIRDLEIIILDQK